jgi:O-antigen ligase
MIRTELFKIKYLLFLEFVLLTVFAVSDFIPFFILLLLILIVPTIYFTFTNPIIGTHLLLFSILVGSLGVAKVSGKAPSIFLVDIIFLYILFLFVIKIFLELDKELKIPFLILMWLPFLLWGLFSFFIAAEKFRAIVIWKNYFAGFISLSFTYFFLKNKVQVKSIFMGLIIWGLLLSLIEIKILFDLGGLSGGIIGLFFKKNLLATSWGKSNYLATFFVMIIPISIGYLLYTTSKKLKFFILLALLFMSSAMILTLSRGGFLVLIVALLVLFVRIIRKKTFIPILTAFLVIITVALLNPLTYVIIDRFATLASSASVFTRINFYEDAWIIFLNNPIVGVGLGNIGLYSQFIVPVASAHNIVLGMLSEVGIIGAILFLSILGRVVWESARKFKLEKNESLKILRWSCISAILGVILHSLMEPNFESMQFSVMVWSFIAANLRLDLLQDTV